MDAHHARKKQKDEQTHSQNTTQSNQPNPFFSYEMFTSKTPDREKEKTDALMKGG